MQRIGVKAQAEANPHKPAFIESDGTTLTYAQLNSRINRLANALWFMGLGPEDKVAVLQHNSGRILEIMNALGKIGAVPVGISYQFRADELTYVVEHSDSKAIIFSDEHADLVAAVRSRFKKVVRNGYIMLDTGRGAAIPNVRDYESLIQSADDQEPQLGQTHGVSSSLIYTSGTTGRPKGVLKRSDKRLNLLLTFSKCFDIRHDDVELIVSPLYHSGPYAAAQMALLFGNTVILKKRFDALETLEAIARYRVTSCFMVPTQLNRILSLFEDSPVRFDTSSLRRIVVSAAPFPYALKEKCVRFFEDVIYEYLGSTETSLISLLYPEEQLKKPESCGRPAPGVDVRILDEEGRDVPTGEVGQIYVKSDALLDCYYKDQEATAKGFKDGYFSVADVGRMDEEGYLYITDRKTDMVISGGVNIYPAEIETCLHRHSKIYDAALVGVPDEIWGEKVVAFIKLKDGQEMTAQEVQNYIKDNLADFKSPKEVYFLSELPYNIVGKLLKRELKNDYVQGKFKSNVVPGPIKPS